MIMLSKDASVLVETLAAGDEHNAQYERSRITLRERRSLSEGEELGVNRGIDSNLFRPTCPHLDRVVIPTTTMIGTRVHRKAQELL